MDYTGKICPYCKTRFVEADDVVVCSICEMPHHKDCWIENRACTTFGCTGTISGLDPQAIPEVAPGYTPGYAPRPESGYTPGYAPGSAPGYTPGYAPRPVPGPVPTPAPRPAPVNNFCVNCGAALGPGQRFCTSCGFRIR